MPAVNRIHNFVLTALAFALAACAPYQISDRSIDFNTSLQDLDNRQVLLNAVRASKRYPPYYTSASQISSSGELDGSQIQFTVPFGPLGHHNYQAQPLVKATSGISVTTLPLDTQEFYDGYMAPVKMSLIYNYLSFGWPKQLIYHAFIQSLRYPATFLDQIKAASALAAQCAPNTIYFSDCKQLHVSDRQLIADYRQPEPGDDEELLSCKERLAKLDTIGAPSGAGNITFVNNPDNLCQFAQFQLVAAMLDKLDMVVFKNDPTKATSKPIVVPTADKDVSIKIQNGSPPADDSAYQFTFTKLPNACSMSSASPAAGQNKVSVTAHHRIETKSVVPSSSPAQVLMPTPNSKLVAPPGSVPAIGAAPKANKQNPPAKDTETCQAIDGTLIVPRSPEAIIFYMGQVISAETAAHRDTRVPMVYAGRSSLPLFNVQKGAAPGGRALVGVAVDGEEYFIERDDDYNNTMHFLTLAEQLIALQKKGSQLPTIPTVQVLGLSP